MRQRDKQAPQSAEETVRDIRRATRRHFSAEDKIRIVLEGLRGEDSIAELCRKEGIAQNLYYRWWLMRFNYLDVDIPGQDFQFPISVEGALGYNNAIQLTQPMHMQDLKYFRDPLWSYGNWVASGETSKCDAFIDNPGSHSWGNTYEQYIAREGFGAGEDLAATVVRSYGDAAAGIRGRKLARQSVGHRGHVGPALR